MCHSGHSCFVKKEFPDYRQASAISQNEKQRSTNAESWLSCCSYQYKTGVAVLSGRPIKCLFDGRRNLGRHGNVPTLNIPACTAPIFLLRGAICKTKNWFWLVECCAPCGCEWFSIITYFYGGSILPSNICIISAILFTRFPAKLDLPWFA